MKFLSIKSFASMAFAMLASLAFMPSCTTDDVVAEVVDPDADVTVAFDFTNASEINALGIATPGAGAGSNLAAETKKNNVIIEVSNAEGANPVRIWATNSGVLDLRIYSKDAITLKAPEGKVIKKISWTTANESTIDSWTTNNGTVEGGVWKGNQAKAVKLTATGTTRINVLSVVYGNQEGNKVGPEPDENNNPTPDPTPDPTPQTPETATVSFDFTSSAEMTALGVVIPGNSAGTTLKSITKDGITIDAESHSENTARLYASKSGVLDLRFYTNDIVKVTVPEGRVISSLSWTTENATNAVNCSLSEGSVAATDNIINWAGNEVNSLSITSLASGGVRMNVLTVTYSTPGK